MNDPANGNGSVYDDIDRFAADYHANQGQTPGPEVLPEGTYDFEVTDARLVKVKEGRESVFRLTLRVLGGAHDGQVLARPSFFGRQESLDYLGGDFVTLGFPEAKDWGRRGKRWSQELLEAAPRLVGLRFTGKRVNGKPSPGVPPFPNLYVSGLVLGGPAPPPAAGAAPWEAEAEWPEGARDRQTVEPEEQGDSDIPF